MPGVSEDSMPDYSLVVDTDFGRMVYPVLRFRCRCITNLTKNLTSK